MFVRLNITLAGVRRKNKNVEIELPEGATVSHALEAYSQKYPVPAAMRNMRGVVILRNKAVAYYGDTVGDGDEITLIRIYAGG